MARLTTLILLGLLPLVFLCSSSTGFKQDQLRFPRVRAAYAGCEAGMMELFVAAGETWPPHQVHLRVFKSRLVDGSLVTPGELELWARSAERERMTLVKTWPIAASSGELGPKRRQGDCQVPEGFYVIDRFNPASSFHLSLGLDYPNASDRVRSDRNNPGGDIFIHGSNVTIGCVPLTDPVIRQLYIACVEARENSGLPIRCEVFPARLTSKSMEALKVRAGDDRALVRFWNELKPGYELFEMMKMPHAPRIVTGGAYVFDSAD